MPSDLALADLIAALMAGGPGDGTRVSLKVTGVLAKYDGDGVEGKEPCEVLRFVDGVLVEHLVQGQPMAVQPHEEEDQL